MAMPTTLAFMEDLRDGFILFIAKANGDIELSCPIPTETVPAVS